MFYKRSFNFFMFASIGSILPLLGLYLKRDIGFSGHQIGLIVSTLPLFSFVAQVFTGYLIDKTTLIKKLLFIYTIISIFFTILLYSTRQFNLFLIMYGIYSLSTSSMILISNIGIIEDNGIKSFGKIRVFGSIGFLIAAGLTPLIIKITRDIFIVSTFMLVITLIFIKGYPEYKTYNQKESFKIKDIFVLKFWIIIIITFIFQVSYSCLDTFLGILINELGYSDEYIGIAWVIGVISELPVMYFTDKIVKKIGVLNFIFIGIVAGTVRWTGYFLAKDIKVIFLLQILHSFTFSALYNGGIYLAYKMFPEKLIGISQSVYDSFSRILGYFVGIIILGIIYERYGLKNVFIFSSILSFISMVLFIIFLIFNKDKTNSKT